MRSNSRKLSGKVVVVTGASKGTGAAIAKHLAAEIIHTAISLMAVGAGAIALVRDKGITSHNGLGKLHVRTTVLACLTGFPIMQHDGFGKPHVLGIVTLLTLVVAALAGKAKLFGRAAAYVETVS